MVLVIAELPSETYGTHSLHGAERINSERIVPSVCTLPESLAPWPEPSDHQHVLHVLGSWAEMPWPALIYPQKLRSSEAQTTSATSG